MRSWISVVLVLLLAIFALLQFGPLPRRANTVIKYALGAVLVPSLLVMAFVLIARPPHYVDTLKTPLPGVTLTFETTSLPLTSDDNTLIAHYEHEGKKVSAVILEGDYVAFQKLVWDGPGHLVVCWKSGRIYNFTNEVTLKAGGATQFFHVTLKEDCLPRKL